MKYTTLPQVGHQRNLSFILNTLNLLYTVTMGVTTTTGMPFWRTGEYMKEFKIWSWQSQLCLSILIRPSPCAIKHLRLRFQVDSLIEFCGDLKNEVPAIVRYSVSSEEESAFEKGVEYS